MRRNWTEQEEEFLEAEYKKGVSDREIAKFLNRSVISVRKKCYTFLERRSNAYYKFEDSEDKELLRLYNSDISLNKIAKCFNRSQVAVRTRLHKIINNTIKNGLIAGQTIQNIAQKLNWRTFEVIDKCKLIHVFDKYPQVKEYYNSQKWRIEFEKNLYDRYRNIRQQAKQRGKEFKITFDEVLSIWNRQRGKCYYTGLNMSIKPGHKMVVSFDRRNNSKFYTKDNVVLCVDKINSMKLDLEYNEFFVACCLIVKNYRDRFKNNPEEEFKLMEDFGEKKICEDYI